MATKRDRKRKQKARVRYIKNEKRIYKKINKEK